MSRRLLILVFILLGLVGVLAGCNGYNDDRGRGDAPVGERLEEPRSVIFNVDRFPNVAIICDGTTAIYTTTREAAIGPAVQNSVYCQGGGDR